jgi:hypothetical protein
MQFDSVQITYQRRSIQGLDQYEHHQATITANVAFTDGEDVSSSVSSASGFVRSSVNHLLGLEDAPSAPTGNVSATVVEKPKAASTETKAASTETAPALPTGTTGVRGANADKLYNTLVECAQAGIEVPSSQINRLPKGLGNSLRAQLKDIQAEPAGGHDDPPLGETDAPEPPGSDYPDADVDIMDDIGDSPSETASAPASEDDGLDDLMADPTPTPAPQFEDIDDAALQERLRALKNRFGGAAEIKNLIAVYAGEGKGAGSISREDRPFFLHDLEEEANSKGV